MATKFKYVPEDEFNNIVADVLKRRQQKWENHLATKTLALGSSNVEHLMGIFQNKPTCYDVKETGFSKKETQRTEFCECFDSGCECVQSKRAEEASLDDRPALDIANTINLSSRNKIKTTKDEVLNGPCDTTPQTSERLEPFGKSLCNGPSDTTPQISENLEPLEKSLCNGPADTTPQTNDSLEPFENSLFNNLSYEEEINSCPNLQQIPCNAQNPTQLIFEAKDEVIRSNDKPLDVMKLDAAVQEREISEPKSVTFSDMQKIETNNEPCLPETDNIHVDSLDQLESPLPNRSNQTAPKLVNQTYVLPEEIIFRLKNILERLTSSLEQLKNHLRILKSNDESEEKDRKDKRANEFVVWFSRNYLYQLKRQTGILKNEKSSKFEDFYKKLYLSFQTALQAVQACLKSTAHNSISPCKKLIEFLNETIVLYEYCIEELGVNPDLEKLIELTKEVFAIIEENILAQEKAEIKLRTKVANKKNAANPKNNVPKKLSMYGPTLPRDCWEKKSLKLAKKKFGSPKSKNSKAKGVSVSSKHSENALISKQKKVSESSFDKIPNKIQMECGSEMDKLKVNQIDDNLSMVKQDLFPERKLRTVVETVAIDDDDQGIPLPSNNDERLRQYLLLEKLTNYISIAPNKNETESENVPPEEKLQKIFSQLKELYRSYDVDLKKFNKSTNNYPNSRVICLKHDEGYRNKERRQEFDKNGIISADGKGWCIPISVEEDRIEAIENYRNAFENQENMLSSCDTEELLNLVEGASDAIILRLIHSVAEEMETGISLLTDKLYELELTEVCR